MIVPVATAYAIASAAAFVAYGLDKSRAVRGGRRISENALHGIALLGGWPGALLAARLFRHKTRKLSFLLVLWAIVALHAAAWWLAWREGWLG